MKMKNFNDIAQIEAYLLGHMEEEDRQAFDLQLASDAVLREEVAAYRKIFSGLKGMREEKFAANVAAWAAEARANDNAQIVNGDQLLTVSRGAVIRRMYRRIAVAAAVLLVLGMATVWMVSRQYTGEKLVAGAYVAPLSGGTMGGQGTQTGDLEKQFQEAHRLFKDGDYGEAAEQFGTFVRALEANPDAFDSLTRKTYLDNTRWTMLLSQFAAGQLPEQEFMQALKNIAADPASDYATKAQELRKDLRSFWRAFAR